MAIYTALRSLGGILVNWYERAFDEGQSAGWEDGWEGAPPCCEPPTEMDRSEKAGFRAGYAEGWEEGYAAGIKEALKQPVVNDETRLAVEHVNRMSKEMFCTSDELDKKVAVPSYLRR